MVADGLTKVKVFPHLMLLLTTGVWLLKSSKDKPVKVRSLRKVLRYTEHDLLNIKG